MKRLLLLLLSLCFIGSANAVSSPDDYFTSLCIGEKTTGFNWVDNSWKSVNFNPETQKYIAKKVDPAELTDSQCHFSRNSDMYDRYFTLSSNNQPKLSTNGCYSIYRFGGPELHFRFECNEIWSTYARQDEETNPKKRKLESVMCWDNQFFFSPNGLFHSATLHGNVEAYIDYKDSLYLTTGKCSTL